MSAKLEEVTEFLKAFKGAYSKGSPIMYPGRVKNWEVLSALGMTQTQRTESILALKPTDYVSGPLIDESGRKGKLWVFGAKYERSDIYIKLKLSPTKKGPRPICISFHIADHPLSYPLREEKE